MKTSFKTACFAALLTATIGFQACKKSDSAVAKEQTNYLTASAWTKVSMEWRRKSDGSWVAPPSWAPVYYSPTMTFLDTYTFIFGPSGTTGTWQYSSDKKQIITTRNSTSFTSTIEVLNGSTLQLSRPLEPNEYTTQSVNGSTVYTYYDKERTNFTH